MAQREIAITYAIPTAALLLVAPVVAAPLAIYTVTLAAFGLPHVLSELRYVDRRFGRRLGAWLLVRIGILLILIAAARTAAVLHLLAAKTDILLELSAVVLLALSVAFGGWIQRCIAIIVAFAIGAATFASPYETAVVFAILHNFTPLGFLWQLLPRGRRLAVMAAASFGLLGVPLLVASGLPLEVLAAHGIFTEADPVHAGALGDHLYVYVPSAWLATRQAIDLFSASVVAQCLHYLSVIVVLPMMLARIEPEASGLVAWPRANWFYALTAAAGVVAFFRFAQGFSDARAFYGIAASFHAWLEIPVLILALTGRVQPKKESSPAAQDAVLATSETSIAR